MLMQREEWVTGELSWDWGDGGMYRFDAGRSNIVTAQLLCSIITSVSHDRIVACRVVVWRQVRLMFECEAEKKVGEVSDVRLQPRISPRFGRAFLFLFHWPREACVAAEQNLRQR